MLSTSRSKLDSLPERPPTPPRDVAKAIDAAIDFLDDSNEVERLTRPTSTIHQQRNSYNVTPSSSQDNDTNAADSRRVNFSPHPHYHKSASAGSPTSPFLKRSPSKDAKPVKSILKQSNAAPPTPDDFDSRLNYFSPQIPGSFNKMLQSVLQQLAGPSRSSRLDAYMALGNALRVYEDPPDASAMVQKMDLVMQFLTRDMAWKGMDGSLDTQVISQALQLTYSILGNRRLAEALDDDFRTFLIDRSITVLDQQDMPKQVVKQHMALMAAQKFRQSVMTSGRAEKLVNALQTIENRCSGHNVVGGRLGLYGRLVEQAPTVMLNRIPDWLHHVFHGMLSSIRDIRQRAIETCTKAGLCLGAQPYAAKALEDLLRNENEEGEDYYTYFSVRLANMISDKEDGPYVPQIWAAVTLFFRSKRRPLEKWPKFKISWCAIIQKCLNSSDISVRYQATLAWNKLVFAIMPDASTSKPMLSMLTIPISSGLSKIGSDKFSKQVRHYSFDCYNNLLHYGLRPGLTLEEYDNAWDALVAPVFEHAAKASSRARREVCRILTGLLSPNAGVWNINAAFETNPIKPEELPGLEPKWVRSRLAKLLSILEPMLEASLQSLNSTEMHVNATWQLLMQCTAHAGDQEVKTTPDLKEAIALLVNALRRMWNECTLSPQDVRGRSWLKQYVSLINKMVETLGPMSFSEEILARTDSDAVQVAPTPSHRSSKHHGAPLSPMIILFGQFYHPATSSHIDDEYRACARGLLRHLLSSKSGPSMKLELLSRSLHTWLQDLPSDVDAQLVTNMWLVVAETAVEALQSATGSSLTQDSQDSQTLGHGIRSGVNIFLKGLGGEASPVLLQTLKGFFETLYNTAKAGAGEGGVVLAVIEPLAKAMLDGHTCSSLEMKLLVTSQMLRTPVWPKTRQAMDQSRKALWGVGMAPHKVSVFDPFEQLYILVQDLMTTSYDTLLRSEGPTLPTFGELITLVIQFLRKAPISLLPTALRKVQGGFAVWVGDSDRKTSGEPNVAHMVCTMWSSMIELLRMLPSKDSNILKALETLLVAGFSSPHRAAANQTIMFWNDTFGRATSLDYPVKLEAVLRARLATVEIELPTFPEDTEDRIPASLPEFFESQSQSAATSNVANNSDEQKRVLKASLAPPSTLPSGFFTSRSSPLQKPNSASSPLRRTLPASANSTPKPRLRHNDSQIEFAPIDSSPLQPNDDSQQLTEHQKEVKARQEQNAQLFPDLSSSPMAHSTALPKNVSKRLDFTSEVNRTDGEAYGTPTGLPDATTLPSDDVPSSPTPSSTRAASQGSADILDEQDDVALDPPSSPPQAANDRSHRYALQFPERHEAQQNDTGVDDTDPAELDDPAIAGAEGAEKDVENADAVDVGPSSETEKMVSATEFPSDSQLPNTQLQIEEEEAALRSVVATKNRHHDGVGGTQQNDESKTVYDDISRVENSFIEPNTNHGDDNEASQVNSASPSQSSRNPSRKRKRSSGSQHTSKKRKHQSPLKRLWSSFIGGSPEDDEDMGEEIVVASSRVSTSPASSRIEQIAISPEEPTNEAPEPVGQPVKEEAVTMQPPPKRRRGRPRKSGTPTPSVSEAGPSPSLKRRASTISNLSVESSQIQHSVVKDTPAPAKAAKEKNGQDVKRGGRRPAKFSQESTTSEGVVRREASGVVISSRESSQVPQVLSGGRQNDVASSPDGQLAGEQAIAGSSGRVMLTPKSILGRLRDALSDFRGMVLGSQDEREFDDVLFELRRETHDAARRGRQE